MGVPVSKSNSFNPEKNALDPWNIKLFSLSNKDFEERSNFHFKTVSQEVPVTVPAPLIQDLGLFLITEENPLQETNSIQKPNSFSVACYDRSTIANNEETDLQKEINGLNFTGDGAFAKNIRVNKALNNGDYEEILLSQSLIINNQGKAKGLLRDMFPGQKLFSGPECQFGMVFVGRNKKMGGLVMFIFQEEAHFEGLGEKKQEVVDFLLEMFNLELWRLDFGVVSEFLKRMRIFRLKSLRSEPRITTGFFKYLWQIEIADSGVSHLFSVMNKEEKAVMKGLIRCIFRDVCLSVLSLSLKGKAVSKLQASEVFYIKTLGLFFFWVPPRTQKANNLLLNINMGKNLCLVPSEENLSSIKLTNNYSENPLEEKSFLNSLDFGVLTGPGKKSHRVETYENNDFSLQINNLSLESVSNYKDYLKKEQEPEFEDQKASGSLANEPNIEVLGKFFKGLLESAELESPPTLSYVNYLNEETYFSYYESYFLHLNSNQIHRARNFLQFFLDEIPERRISLTALMFYLEHKALRPWSLLFSERNEGSFTSVSQKTCTIKTKTLIYEGEYRIICENKTLHGKGTLRQRDSGEIIYEGGWKRSKPHGKGSLYLFAGAFRYRGEFRNGRFHGEGTLWFRGTIICKGMFQRNCFYNFTVETQNAGACEIIEEVGGCIVTFSNPVKVLDCENSEGKFKELLGFSFRESPEFEVAEFDVLKVRPKERVMSRICEFIVRKCKGQKVFVIMHCLKDEDIWVIDGFDVTTLHARLRVYVSTRPMNVKKYLRILRGLRELFEDFGLKLFQADCDCETHEIESLIEEVSTKLFSLYKLKKLDILGHNSLGEGFKGKEITEKLFNSFVLHKLKKMELKSEEISDGFFENMRKSPYLSTMEDLVLKNCRKMTDSGFLYLSEVRALNQLRSLTIVKTGITNEGLLSLAKADFLEGLEKLNLSQNPLLDDNGFSDFFCRSSMKFLKKLYLSWNRITDLGVKALFECGQLISLKKLKLRKCPVFDTFSPDEFSHLKMLSKIDLRETLVRKQKLLAILKTYPNLKILRIGNCQMISNLDLASVMAISEMKNMKKLDLGGLHIFPAHVEFMVKNMNKLITLNFKANPLILNQTVLDLLKSVTPKLFELNLSETQISDECLVSFANIGIGSELRNLFLKKTGISDSTISVLFEKGLFPQLRVLNVSQTDITDSGIVIIANNLLVAKLYDLNISKCNRVRENSIQLLLHYYPNSYLKRLNVSGIKLGERTMNQKNFVPMKGLMKLLIKNCGIEKEDLKRALKNRMIGSVKFKVRHAESESDSLGGFHRMEQEREGKVLDYSGFQGVNEFELLLKIPKAELISQVLELNLEDCPVGDGFISWVVQMKSPMPLKRLNLSKSLITDHGLFLASVAVCFRSLVTLELRECLGITDQGVMDILKSLVLKIEGLDISSTRIGNITIDWMIKELEKARLQDLKEIWMYFCAGVVPEKLLFLNKNYGLFCYF